MKAVILRLAWRGFLYSIWKERNNRIFAQKSEGPQQVFDRLYEAVKIRLSKMNLVVNQSNSMLLRNWGV